MSIVVGGPVGITRTRLFKITITNDINIIITDPYLTIGYTEDGPDQYTLKFKNITLDMTTATPQVPSIKEEVLYLNKNMIGYTQLSVSTRSCAIDFRGIYGIATLSRGIVFNAEGLSEDGMTFYPFNTVDLVPRYKNSVVDNVKVECYIAEIVIAIRVGHIVDIWKNNGPDSIFQKTHTFKCILHNLSIDGMELITYDDNQVRIYDIVRNGEKPIFQRTINYKGTPIAIACNGNHYIIATTYGYYIYNRDNLTFQEEFSSTQSKVLVSIWYNGNYIIAYKIGDTWKIDPIGLTLKDEILSISCVKDYYAIFTKNYFLVYSNGITTTKSINNIIYGRILTDNRIVVVYDYGIVYYDSLLNVITNKNTYTGHKRTITTPVIYTTSQVCGNHNIIDSDNRPQSARIYVAYK